MFQVYTCLAVEHDWRLVALAGLVCFLASAAAISLFRCAQNSAGRERWIWLGLDAAATGYGIWATHFIAILAYDHTLGAGYNLTLTIISLLFALLMTAAGLIVALSDFARWSAAFGGTIIGCGIAVMHFTGIAALDLPGRVTWSPGLVAAAIASGMMFGSFSFFVATKGTYWRSAFNASILLALAVLTTHFIAMGAMSFVRDPTHALEQASLSAESLSLLVAGFAAIILGMCLVAILSDLQSKEKIRLQKVLLDTALNNMSQGLCMCDAAGRIMVFNERYAQMMGPSTVIYQGLSLLDMFKQMKAVGNFDGQPEDVFSRVMAGVREGKSDVKVHEVAGGRAFRVMEQPMQGGGWVSTMEDITEWRKDQAKIAHMAHHDPLTNLPNRTFFRKQLEQAIGRTDRNAQVALLCIDLDHFKEVNDSLGHPVGDKLLKEVACRLTVCVRKSDVVARLGGDEFAIVQVSGVSQPLEAASLAARIVERIGAPYVIEGHQIIVGASIGISISPGDGTDPDKLLKNADLALYLSKEDGRGAFRFFEVGIDARAQARQLLLMDLRAAILRHEFEVYYQPIYDLKADRIVCFEALIRWNHPLRGMVEPLSFVPLAEETGLIVPIGNWILRKACADAAGWSQGVSVAVNLSPMQFKNRNLVPFIIETLTASGLAPNRLELEITESVLLQDSQATLAALHQLHAFGVHISMDDFGTGYSSLSYLRSFPFDKIKIDRSFVHELASHGDSMSIIRAVTGLGKSLGIVTIAEGVETSEQLALLRAEGCTEVQGFLLNQPQPASQVENMLSKGMRISVA